MPCGMFRCAQQLRHAQRKPHTKAKPVSQKEVTWKCFSAFSLDLPSCLFLGGEGMQSGSLAQCHWPCHWSEKSIWPAPWCALWGTWPSRNQWFHSGTSSFLCIDQPSSTCQIPADSSRCNSDITYKLLSYKVTQIPPTSLLITYF